MSFPTVHVARGVCGDIPPTIPVNIDCSLCGLGWPQASGEIMFNLYRGNNCAGSESGILGDYSYWLNGAYLPGRFQFQCRNPGADAEPNKNEWVAGGEFSWGGTWRLDCVLTVLSKTRVKVEGSIRWLNPATMKLEVWATFSKEMDEDNPQGITDPRRHRIFRSGKVEITPNAASGGIGDPVTHIAFVLGTRPMIVGCGTELCSMWDGQHYYTCFRAEVTDTGGIPALSQMGKSQQPCGGRDQYGQFQPWCFCDQITLKASGLHETAVNADPAFVAEYGFVGSPPNDVAQQVQVGGGLLVKRWGSGPTRIWTKDLNGNWDEGTYTVTKDYGPTIWTASFGSPVYRTAKLYSLAFPSPNILPEGCEPDPAPPGPGAWLWYCVDGTCIQSNVRPPTATGGPYPDLFTCQGSNCEAPPPEPPPSTVPWWCVSGTCIESTPNPGGGTGPYATKLECESNCQPPPPSTVYVCTNEGSCIPMDRVWADEHGVGYWETELACMQACVAEPPPGTYSGFYCVPVTNPTPEVPGPNTCIQWGDSTKPPATAISGPYQNLEDCSTACQTPPPENSASYWCVQSDDIAVQRCVQSMTQPPATVSGPHLSQAACLQNCGTVVDPEPVLARSVLPQEENRPITDRMARIHLILRVPCVHLGEPIDDPAKCGCGVAVRYSCSKHGICRRVTAYSDGVIACVNCGDYESKV